MQRSLPKDKSRSWLLDFPERWGPISDFGCESGVHPSRVPRTANSWAFRQSAAQRSWRKHEQRWWLFAERQGGEGNRWMESSIESLGQKTTSNPRRNGRRRAWTKGGNDDEKW